jgi:hypothetical protein
MKKLKLDFNKISVKGVKYYKDKDGKRKRATKEFWQTVNPFNINSNGIQKTRHEIFHEIMKERDVWLSE